MTLDVVVEELGFPVDPVAEWSGVAVQLGRRRGLVGRSGR